jgi:hypothetical protein
MATNFPTSLDSLTNPATTDQLNSPSHAAQHANANDAIEQLQAKVGVDGSTVTTSHDYKIAQLEAAITAGSAGTKLIYQDVRNQSGASLTKGTPVRVTGSVGASGKLLVGSATNATEAGSSKTFGIVSSTIANNSNGQAVTNGLLEGVDTTGAVDGDPVWLGVNGAKIFGLANKPVAPAHLVYLGVVVRGGEQNTGSIFVSIQNGFEVEELHNVLITSLANKDALVYDSTTQLWKNYDLSNDFVLSGDLQNSLGDYIPLNALGQPSGPATLDADGNLIVPENKIIIEGATADAHELTLQAPDVVSDITVTLPNAAGTLALTSDITTAVNNLVSSAPNTLDTLNELATALGNDANFATTTATSIGNKVSKAGGDVITSSLPGVIGLTVKGAASQTGNLLEFRNSGNTLLTYITPTGHITASSAAISTLYSGGQLQSGTMGYFNATTFAPSVSPIVVRGTTSQSADLTQWQNVGGTVLAKINSAGELTTPNLALSTYGGIYAPGSYMVLNPADTRIVSTGLSVGATSVAPSAQLQVTNNVAGTTAMIVKGATSQTADLTQWQITGGTVRARIDAYGTFQNGTASGYGAWINVQPAQASDKGIIVRGATSQSANLQEWQNSSGNVLASIGSNGSINTVERVTASNGISVFNASSFGAPGTLLPFTYDSIVNISTLYATSPGLVIRGVDSQTADLQQWRNISGSVIAKVDSTGAMFTTTAAANTNNTQVATTAYVQTELADLVNSAPATLDTLKELSDALGADANFATTVTNNLALKAPLASPALTGTPTAPTAAVGTDSTQVATTAFVIDQIDASTQPGALYQTTAPTSPEIGQIWIDSDDNVTVFDSNIIRRQPFTATAGQTNFVTTVPFIDGFEQVYFNGLLLLKTTDYTTSGTNTVILGSAAAVNDIIEVVTITNLNSVNTYTQAETDALLAANTSVAPLSISANTNLLAKKRYFVTSASALTLTLPASPALNDEIQILDASGNASTYNITVARNGRLINGNAGNLIIDNNGGWYTLLYTGATYGWKVG